MTTGLEDVLGPQYAELALRVEADLEKHVAELNERERNLLTVRGFGITSVSALLTATVISDQELLALIAALVVLALTYADLDASRRVQAISRRLPFLERTARDIRHALGRGLTDRSKLRLRTNLRTYRVTPSGADEVPWSTLRKGKALGAFKAVYAVLILGCVFVGVAAIGRHTRVQAFASCVVPDGADVRDAVASGRCARTKKRVTCKASSVVRRSSALKLRCAGVRGPISIALRGTKGRSLSRRVVLGPSGAANVSVPGLPPGTYRIMITQRRSLVDGSEHLRIRR